MEILHINPLNLGGNMPNMGVFGRCDFNGNKSEIVKNYDCCDFNRNKNCNSNLVQKVVWGNAFKPNRSILGATKALINSGGLLTKAVCLVALTCVAFTNLISCSNYKNLLVSTNQKLIDINSSDRIIGGFNVSQNSSIAKHVVAIVSPTEMKTCTGVIIAERVILTAAHCIFEDMIVSFGTDLNAPVDASLVKNTLIAPNRIKNQNEGVDNGDLALLLIEDSIPSGFSPVPIVDISQLATNSNSFYLAGYGVIDQKNDTSSSTLRYTIAKLENANFGNTEIKIDQTTKMGACHGDSGGPLFTLMRDQVYLVGIVSRATDMSNESCFSSGINTKVSKYIPWIELGAKYLLSAEQVSP